MRCSSGFLLIELLVGLCVLSITLLGVAQLHQATDLLLLRTSALLKSQEIAHALMVGGSHEYGSVAYRPCEDTNLSIACHSVHVPYASGKSVSCTFYTTVPS